MDDLSRSEASLLISSIFNKGARDNLNLCAHKSPRSIFCVKACSKEYMAGCFWNSSWHYCLHGSQQVPIRDLFSILTLITTSQLKKNMDFSGAPGMYGKREWQGFSHQGLHSESWWDKGLFSEDWMTWDEEGLLDVRCQFKGCSALPLQQLLVKMLLPSGKD